MQLRPQGLTLNKVRAKCIRAICKDIESRGWDQSSAASHLGLTRPRVAELLNSEISQFSLDALINIGAKLGIHAEVTQTSENAVSA